MEINKMDARLEIVFISCAFAAFGRIDRHGREGKFFPEKLNLLCPLVG
jgi:hypothetical protein